MTTPRSLKLLTAAQAFLEWPLYEPREIDDVAADDRLKDIVEFHQKLDAYCPKCGVNRVYHRLTTNQSTRAVPRPGTQIFTSTSTELALVITFQCSMTPTHLMTFVFLTPYFKAPEKRVLVKVGQWPSLADLRKTNLARYQKELGKELGNELRSAIGLNAHGVGVGSFVYLRRIIEKLKEEAHASARADPNWDEIAYVSASRFTDQLTLLRGYVPEFLSNNAIAYSILSKGIHELTEEECLSFFPVVLKAVEMILEQRINERRQREIESEASKLLHRVHEKVLGAPPSV